MSSSDSVTWKYRKLWLVIGWAWIVAIWYLSLSPEPPPVDLGTTFSDKILHAGAYGLLMSWFMQLYHRRDSRITCMIAFIGMGIFIEYLQGMTASRQFELLDMLANATGVLLALLIVRGKLSQWLLHLDHFIKARR
jgi:VanZ family protein